MTMSFLRALLILTIFPIALQAGYVVGNWKTIDDDSSASPSSGEPRSGNPLIPRLIQCIFLARGGIRGKGSGGGGLATVVHESSGLNGGN